MVVFKSDNPLQRACDDVQQGAYNYVSVPNDRYNMYPALYTNKGQEFYIVAVYYTGGTDNLKKIVAVYKADMSDGNIKTTDKIYEQFV